MCIALLALITSLWPKIRALFIKGKVEVDIHSRINMTHNVGRPVLNVPITIRNIGARTLRVESIRIELIKDDADIDTLLALAYVNPTTNNYLLFRKFILEPNKEWSHAIYFSKYLTRDDNKKLKKAELNRNKKFPNYTNNTLPYIEDNEILEKPFNELFDKNFKWNDGNYVLKFIIETGDKKMDFVQDYEFTIFESQTEFFREEQRNAYLKRINIWQEIEIREKN